MMECQRFELRYVSDAPACTGDPMRHPRAMLPTIREAIPSDACTESFGVAFLDARNRVIGTSILSTGGMSASVVGPREVFRSALLAGATALILFHNHPSGDVSPSHEDASITERLVEAGNLLLLKVLDHIIIGTGPDARDGEYASLRERGLSAL